MDFLEEMVMWNLCARHPNELFFCPQFDIGTGWGCPDFLVLYPPEREIWLVEVSGAANVARLAAKVRDREKEWLTPLRAQLAQSMPAVADWKFHIMVFIRKEAKPRFEAIAGNQDDVKLFVLEDIGFAWEAWGKKLKNQTEKLEKLPD